ncbi:MAG: ABC transporter ATP-binding protein [Rhodobacteraceae bacterium]|nr:MAG: ABC transporter ATP-binding protein [Paracoccaceae bacterium]
MQAQPILEIAGLTKTFGDFTALHAIDLKAREGEFLTIVGPSGSGKTTLIRLLAGLESPTDGAIYLRGQRIEKLPANKRPTCMVFQSLALFPHRSVGENIGFPLKIRGVSLTDRRERALELLDLLQLPRSYVDKRIQDCSGGERQRVALARALAFDPEILFFDEPLSALDYRLRKTLEKELKDLHARTGKTFVYITHSLEEAMVMSDRIAIMRAGRFEQIGTPDDIYARPISRFVAEFMGEVNLFDLALTPEGMQTGPLMMAPGITSRINLRTGSRITMMIRPESITLLDPDEDAEITVTGRFIDEYVLGSRVQRRFNLGDGHFVTVETLREARSALSVGAPMRLGWSLAQAHLIEER